MLAYLLEIKAWWTQGEFYPFAAFMTLVWALWGIRMLLIRRYLPWTRPYNTTTSVIIPVVDEPVDLFRSVLHRITSQQPTEVLVIINGPRNEALEEVCDEARVRWIWTETPGKRNALRIGIEESTGEIAVLVDSDTVWTDDTLRELVKPFRDPAIGGVTTRQRILDPERGVLTRWADWLESVRCEYSMPAMSVLGTVGCLPGRTIAFRRQILVDCLPRFLSDKFLGVYLEVSDDRALTNYTLMAGYKTVYQSTSLVYTDAPLKIKKLAKQQYRWARGSQYNTLRMLRWMLREARFLAVFYLVDIAVPFVLTGTVVAWVSAFLHYHDKMNIYRELSISQGTWRSLVTLFCLAMFMSLLSLTTRFGRHFAYKPAELVYLPVFMAVNTLLLLPIRMLGFFRMGHDSGWGTRDDSYRGERNRSPLVVVPYVIGTLLLAGSVMISVQ